MICKCIVNPQGRHVPSGFPVHPYYIAYRQIYMCRFGVPGQRWMPVGVRDVGIFKF